MYRAFGASASVEASTDSGVVTNALEVLTSGKPITSFVNYNHPVWLGIIKRYPDAAKNITQFKNGLQEELIKQGFQGKDINTIALAAITPIVNQLDAAYPTVTKMSQSLYNQILAVALPKAIWDAVPVLQAVQKGQAPPRQTFNVTQSMLQAAAPRVVAQESVDARYFRDPGIDIPPRTAPEATPWYEQTKYQIAMAVGAVAVVGAGYYYFRKH